MTLSILKSLPAYKVRESVPLMKNGKLRGGRGKVFQRIGIFLRREAKYARGL